MSEPKPKRRWFRFSLRTLFLVVTVACLWLGYQIHWIHERRSGRDWLDRHSIGGSIGFQPESRPGIPWSLMILGEKPIEKIRTIGALDNEKNDLPMYRKRVAEVSGLFPECQIVDVDAFDWTPN
jgi:hypothetical protein